MPSESDVHGSLCELWHLRPRPAIPCRHESCWEVAATADYTTRQTGIVSWWFWHPDEDDAKRREEDTDAQEAPATTTHPA